MHSKCENIYVKNYSVHVSDDGLIQYHVGNLDGHDVLKNSLTLLQ